MPKCVLNLSENLKKKKKLKVAGYFIRTVIINTKGFFKIFFALSCWTRHQEFENKKDLQVLLRNVLGFGGYLLVTFLLLQITQRKSAQTRAAPSEGNWRPIMNDQHNEQLKKQSQSVSTGSHC